MTTNWSPDTKTATTWSGVSKNSTDYSGRYIVNLAATLNDTDYTLNDATLNPVSSGFLAFM